MCPAHTLVRNRLIRIAAGQQPPIHECTVRLIANQLFVTRAHDQPCARRQRAAQFVCAHHMLIAVLLLIDVPQQIARQVVRKRKEAVMHERCFCQFGRRGHFPASSHLPCPNVVP